MEILKQYFLVSALLIVYSRAGSRPCLSVWLRPVLFSKCCRLPLGDWNRIMQHKKCILDRAVKATKGRHKWRRIVHAATRWAEERRLRCRRGITCDLDNHPQSNYFDPKEPFKITFRSQPLPQTTLTLFWFVDHGNFKSCHDWCMRFSKSLLLLSSNLLKPLFYEEKLDDT